jgi:ketosteroid isomerase-like protein
MNDMTAVRRAVERLLAGALGPMLDLLAEDVEFEVASGGDLPSCRMASGRQPVVEYFAALGGLTAFWQMDYTAMGRQLIARGNESFTVEHCELEGGCELALVFDLAEGKITRLLVIEDLASFVRGGDSPIDASTNSGSGGSTLGEPAPYGAQHEPVLHGGSLVPL